MSGSPDTIINTALLSANVRHKAQYVADFFLNLHLGDITYTADRQETLSKQTFTISCDFVSKFLKRAIGDIITKLKLRLT